MRSLPSRLVILSLTIFILVSASVPGTLASSQYTPMQPGDFELYNSDHFDMYYDSTRITDLSTVIAAANDAYANVTGFFGDFEYRNRIILAASQSQYNSILYNYLTNDNVSDDDVAGNWGDAGSGTIVIVSPEQLPNFEAVLTHQFALIAMRTELISNKYDIPRWFSEGLAIYISGDISDAGKTMVEDACREGKMMTVAQVETVLSGTGDSESRSETDMAYAQSGMLMQYIIDKYGEDNVRYIMQDYATTGDLEKAFMKRIGYSPEGVNADWQVNLKGELSARDGAVTTERVYGYVKDASGLPLGNETVVFTCMRNDPAVLNKPYTARTNTSGYYSMNLTYGLFTVYMDHDGYVPVNTTLTIDKGQQRFYNLVLTKAELPKTQNVLTGSGLADETVVYAALGAVNVLAVLLLIFIFWRARK